MRFDSPSSLKGSGRGLTNKDRMPTPGSKTREAYDLFKASAGHVVNFRGAHSQIVSQLRDFWGLDLRKVRQGRWICVGEWMPGGVYRDFVAERMEREGNV